MSETPRTDAVAECLPIYGPSDAEYVPADFARQLERDLTASQARVRVLEEALRDLKLEVDACCRSGIAVPPSIVLKVEYALGKKGGRK